MLPGNEANARLVELARRLAEQTRAGRIGWTRNGSRYLYAGTSGAVVIDREPFGRIVMQVRDQSGSTVDELATGVRASLPLDPQAHAALKDLYAAVSDSARRVVDSLIAEIG